MAKALQQTFEMVDVDVLQSHPRNPRRGDVPKIGSSIVANGFYGAVVVQKSTGFILKGNHSWAAAKSKGLKKVPVLWADVNDKAALQILLVDNKTSDESGYDETVRAALLMDLRGPSLEGTGYQEVDLGRIFETIGREILAAYEPPANEEEEAKAAAGSTGARSGRKTGAQMGDLEFRVVITCTSEQHQAELMEQFEGMGLTCKPLIS
jgi:ParB-like chromosome segregation protein Spo0J